MFAVPPRPNIPAKSSHGSGLTVLACGGIAAAACLVYSNSFSGPFVLDDSGAIVHNETIRSLWNSAILTAPPAGTTVSGRPLLNFSLAVNYALSGERVWSYHLFNLAIHILAGCTLFGIVRRTLERRKGESSLFCALAVALIWTVHPLQTQAVTYIVQRAESLMGLFYLLTLYCFIRATESEGEMKGRGAWLWKGLSLTACLAGMATKEVMVTAPVMVLLYDRTFLAGSYREAWKRRRGLYVALASTWILLAFLVASTGGNRSGTSGFNVGVPWRDYWLTQFEAVVRYLGLCFWPRPLIFEYGTFWVRHFSEAAPYALIVLPLAAVIVVALMRPARPDSSGIAPVVGFLGAWFFGILSVTSVIPGIYQMIVEHRMYLPLAAVVTGTVLGLWRTFGRPVLLASLAGAVALGCATYERNADYATAVSLWQDTVNKRPENETAETSLAIALFSAGRMAEAIPHYERALKMKPDATDTLNDAGVALLSVGRKKEGIAHLQHASRLEPDVPQYHYNLATGLAADGQLEEAIAQFREAIRLKPDYASAHLRLGLALWMTGHTQEAILERGEGQRLQGTASH